jgi:hypothetical protein
MANARRPKDKTTNASQSGVQRTVKPKAKPKPKPKPRAKGKKVREATPLEPEGEEDDEERDGEGSSQSDADRGALRSKIEALERQLKTRKKGSSGDSRQDERLEGELFSYISAPLMYYH